jgi:hypothetical protein
LAGSRWTARLPAASGACAASGNDPLAIASAAITAKVLEPIIMATCYPPRAKRVG